MLQVILVTEGLAIARYINGYLPNSKYVQAIYQAQDYAAKNKLKLWSTGDSEYLSKAEGLSVPYEGEGASGNSSSAGFMRDDASVSEDVYYENCDAVRVAGKDPILKGELGFREQFDGDRDGVGCEKVSKKY